MVRNCVQYINYFECNISMINRLVSPQYKYSTFVTIKPYKLLITFLLMLTLRFITNKSINYKSNVELAVTYGCGIPDQLNYIFGKNILLR